MLITVKSGEEYYPRYKDMWVTDSKGLADAWNDGEVIPDSSSKMTAARMGRSPLFVPEGRVYYVWRKDFIPEENEYGPECP